MPELTASTFCLLGVPLALQADLDASTLGQAGPRSLGAIGEEDGGGRAPRLTIGSSGEQTAGKVIDLRTLRGGPVPGRAGGAWKGTDDDDYRGLVSPVCLRGFHPQDWDVTGQYRCCAPITLSNGKQLVFYAQRIGGGITWTVRCYTFDPVTDELSSTASVRSGLDADHLPWPWPVELDDGRLLVFYWVANDAETLANIDVSVSADDGATWSLYAESVLQSELVDTTSATLGRITAAISYQQAALTFHLTDTTIGEEIWHWFSADMAATFEYLGARTNTAYPVLTVCNGVMYLHYLGWSGAGAAKVYIVPIVPNELFSTTSAINLSQFGGLDVGDAALSGGVLILARGDLSAAVEGCFIWCWAIHTSGTTQKGVAVKFDTRTGAADVRNQYAYWWYDGKGTTTEYPKEYAACFYRRQAWLWGGSESGSATYETKLTAWKLGGWTTVTMPMASTIPQDANYATWNIHYVPLRAPASFGWTFAGAGTQDVTTTPGWLRNNTSANSAYDTLARTVASDEGMFWWFKVRVVSGGSITSTAIGATMEMATVAQRWQAALHLSTTQIRIQDVHGAAARGTVTISTTSGVDVQIAINAGKVSAWVRLAGDDWDQEWTPIVEGGTLTDGGAGGSDAVVFGNITAGTAISEWQVVAGVDGTLLSVGASLADGPTNPDDLRPGDYPVTPLWLGEGVSIAARGGPAASTDSYRIYPDARYALRYAMVRGEPTQLEYIRGGTRPGPSQLWRSLDAASITFPAFARWDFTDHANRTFPNILIFHFIGYPAATVSIRKHVEGGASVALGIHDQTVNTTGLAFERTGPMLSVDTGTASTTEPWIAPDELVGGWVVEGSVACPILRNSAGRWSNDGNAETPLIEVGGDYASLSSSGTMAIIPPQSTFVYFNTTGEGGAGFEIYHSSAPVTADGYLQGKIAICEGIALYFGPDWGEERSFTQSTEVRRSLWGADFPRQTRTMRKTLVLPFTRRSTDVLLRGSSAIASRAYYRASSTVGAPIVATSTDTQTKLRGIWEQAKGGAIPLVWLERVVRGTPNTASYTLGSVGFIGTLQSIHAAKRAGGREESGIRSREEEGNDWILEELK